MEENAPDNGPVTVAALYRFARFDDPEAIRSSLETLCGKHGVRGTLLLAHEGINGTIAGSADGIAAVLAHVRSLPDCAALDVKYADAPAMPFGRLKVRVKREIVTLGVGDLDPAANAGIHVEPRDWDRLIDDPDVILIDTRNDYEVAIGSFPGALHPGTRSFRDFPAWFDALTERLRSQGRRPRMAMFCTGGIRCEKSTALARSRGFDQVYHLKGGILRYLEEIPEAQSRWTGDCFVFDERVAVGHGLSPGRHRMCRTCGWPMPKEGLDARDCPECGTTAPPQP